MKGFIITLDAAIAILFVLFAILIISNQSYIQKAPGTIYLKQLTMDLLTIMHKTGRFSQALEGNSSAVSEIIEATPHLACIQVSIINVSGNDVFNMTKNDCNSTTNVDIQATSMPLLYNGSDYIVRSESWLRKEGS
ncbi:MAG: hypothetical protein ACP5N9_04040 [Candidatus Bilamarchaeum sp.]